MVTISLCMIVRDEELVLGRCLDSAADLVDEIIIVDTGSSDRTKEIARQYTDEVYDFPWKDDFAAARNESFSKATKDYCMWLDADDVLLEKDRKNFAAMKKRLTPHIDVVMLPYHTAFDENGNVTFLYYRERIVRNADLYRWEGEVHEAITPKGIVVHEEIAVTHQKLKPSDPKRNVNILERKYQSEDFMPPRQHFYYGQELYFTQQYEKAISILEDYLKMEGGWVENQLEACEILSICYRQTGHDDLALRSLLKSLELAPPRGELCCKLGDYFLSHSAYQQAIFWYELALSKTYDATKGSFVLADCYGYIPSLQLTVCYDRIGQWEKAREYNERAAAFKPNSKAVEFNRVYFENKGKAGS